MGGIWSSEGFTSEVVTVKPLINTEFTTSLAMQLPVENDRPWMSHPPSICLQLNLLRTARARANVHVEWCLFVFFSVNMENNAVNQMCVCRPACTCQSVCFLCVSLCLYCRQIVCLPICQDSSKKSLMLGSVLAPSQSDKTQYDLIGGVLCSHGNWSILAGD